MYMKLKDGKSKVITFSYDDGVVQDIRLTDIFNKHGLKGTFNINTGLYLSENEERERFYGRMKLSEAKKLYIDSGYEVAVHTLTHPNLVNIENDKEVLRQVEQDRINLSELVGYEVKGMAYPCGGKNCDDRVANIIKNNTIIEYARTIDTTKNFEPFNDLYQYKGTLYHHNDWNLLFDMGMEFLELQTDTPKIFYIWGHSYEFDIYPERWKQFEQFCEMISNHHDIFYGTNKEVLCHI